MPTARELLEQADLLMRRNRSLADDDIPVLTEAVPEPREARVLRGRGAQTHPGGAGAPALADEDGDAIPTLTERVETTPAADIAPEDAGDPSLWLQEESGEPSVTGDIPDSVLMVPAAEDASIPADVSLVDDSVGPAALRTRSRGAVGQETPAEDIEVVAPFSMGAAEDAFDEEFARAAQVMEAAPNTLPPAANEIGGEFEPDARANEPQVPGLEGSPPAVNEALEEIGPPIEVSPIEVSPIEVFDLSTQVVPFAEPSGVMPEPLPPATADSDSSVTMPQSRATMSEPPITMPESPVTVSESSPPTTDRDAPPPLMVADLPVEEPAPIARDDAKWDGIAEEIRMQVLQRIDIFTDTGLREQLALRLQPIVDRASADLVATINQHVGELLRSYVAEAIEREIESWRRGH